MDFFQSLAVARTMFILGVFNLLAALTIFFTCRCLPGSKVGVRLMQYGIYKRVYKYHCYIWRVFWPSIMVHAFFALMYPAGPVRPRVAGVFPVITAVFRCPVKCYNVLTFYFPIL